MPISVFLFNPKAVLRASGPDALSFLQGQFTQDINGAFPAPVAYGLWLTQKGKVVGDSHVLVLGPEEVLLVSSATSAERLRQRLEDYLVADEVELVDETSAWSLMSLYDVGSKGMEDFPALPSVCNFSREREGYLYAVSRDVESVWDWLVPSGGAALPAGAVLLSPEEVELRRIKAGIPRVGTDVGENDLPNEAGLEAHAISYTKGCYLGQEVMARLKAMGQVRRRLIAVKGEGVCPATPAEVMAGGRVVGELRSAVRSSEGWLGMAMISLVTWDRASAFQIGAETAVAVG